MVTESTIRALDRQGMFKGDLNWIQYYALNWLMGKEFEDEQKQERDRIFLNALAANEGANPVLIKHLREIDSKQEAEEEASTQWLTPNSDEELNEILEQFNQLPLS